ncbi:MAG: TetR family transcriptional regulator, partial [Nocardioidaceae bacterium]
MGLSQDQIVSAALQLLERDGLDGVSFRKIAAELEVSAPTLYWHVDSKRRLLDLMAARLMAETERLRPAEPGQEESWWEWLEHRTRAMYETLIRHRDAPLVAAGNRPTVSALPAIEVSLATLIDAGFEPGDAIETILTLGAFA